MKSRYPDLWANGVCVQIRISTNKLIWTVSSHKIRNIIPACIFAGKHHKLMWLPAQLGGNMQYYYVFPYFIAWNLSTGKLVLRPFYSRSLHKLWCSFRFVFQTVVSPQFKHVFNAESQTAELDLSLHNDCGPLDFYNRIMSKDASILQDLASHSRAVPQVAPALLAPMSQISHIPCVTYVLWDQKAEGSLRIQISNVQAFDSTEIRCFKVKKLSCMLYIPTLTQMS